MNIVKLFLQKIGLVGSVVITWILDAIPIIGDDTVWFIVDMYLKVICRLPDTTRKEKLDALKKFWDLN